VLVNPEELVGVNFLWQVVYKNEQGPVVEAAVLLFTQVYLSISDNQNKKLVRVNLIEKVLAQILHDIQTRTS
jgi:hypothetical protein